MMNDRRFKELVNLHLDHRLSPGEAAELEHALREDPARRRQLAAYAAMQQGCSLVCRRSAAGAPASAALLRAIRDAERKVHAPVAVRSVWSGWAGWGATAGLAAAAFAIVVVRMNTPGGPNIEFTVAEAQEADGAVAMSVVSAKSAPGGSGAVVSSPASLPAHLTLAALGIAGESRREVGVVSRWSYPLDDLTEQEVQRAVAWARHANDSEWGTSGGSQVVSRFSTAGGGDGFRAGQVSFATDR